MSVDVSKLKIVPESDVPYRRQTKWDEVFSAIPKGKAVALSESEGINADSVRSALLRRQHEGKYKNLRVIVRGPRGKRRLWIVNPT